MLWNKELRVIDQEATHTSASVQLAFSFNGSESGYPFLLTVKIRYLLSVDGFFVTVEAKNDDPGWPLPFFNGWHPYFLATLHTATLTLDPCSTGWNHVDVDTGPQFPPPRYSNMVRKRCSRSSWALEDSAGGAGPCSTCCQALLPQHCTCNDCKRTLQEYEPPLSPFELYTDFCNFIDAAVLNVTYIMIEGADDAYCALVKV